MKNLNIYERLMALADDPEKFEQERLKLLEECLSEFPEEMQVRIKALQWKIDQELDKHTNATDRYNTMIGLFWECFDKFNQALTNPAEIMEQHQKADVISFKKK